MNDAGIAVCLSAYVYVRVCLRLGCASQCGSRAVGVVEAAAVACVAGSRVVCALDLLEHG